MAEPLGVGVTYLPAETGIHMWQEFSATRVEYDLATIRSVGITAVRVHLAWDAFMPSHRQVDRRRLGDLGALLAAAVKAGVFVVPVLFAQSHGDCVQLPRYAVARGPGRRGVRVVCDGNVVAGAPRDQWADPLMIEAAELWLRTLLDAFANHPAIEAWDLGHDPATTMRPRRIAEMAAWVELFALLVKARGDAVRLTLGSADVLTARGVRPAAVAPHLDSLGLVLDPRNLPPIAGSAPDPAAADFALEMAMRLAADGDTASPAVQVVTGVAVAEAGAEPDPGETGPVWDVEPLEEAVASRVTGELLGRLAGGGAAGLWATSWCVHGARVRDAPPCDRRPSLALHGLATGRGETRAHGEIWTRLATAQREAMQPVMGLAPFEVESYYRELPDSARDLFAAWRTEVSGDG